jgi:hypothetical protein
MPDLTPQHFANAYKGGEVKLSPGRYTTATPIVIRGAKGFQLRGEGVTLVGEIEFNGCHDFSVSGFTFSGDRASRGPNPVKPTLRLTACSDFQLENTEHTDARGDHLYIAQGCTGGTFRDSIFTGAYRNGISIINASHLLLERLTIRDVNGHLPAAGIDIEANGDGTGDDAKGCNHDIAIRGCTIENVGGRSILGTGLNPPNRVTVQGCTLSGPITLVGNEHTVTGNHLDGMGRSDIGVGVRGERGRVEDNDITNGKHLAILLAGPGGVESGNRCTGYATASGEAVRVEQSI